MYSESYDFRIADLENYTKSCILKGQNKDEQTRSIVIPVNEFSALELLELYYIQNGRKKKFNVEKNITVSTISFGSFFTGSKNYIVPIPAQTEFELIYQIKEKHTIFLSKMYKKGIYESAEVSYNFQIPVNLVLTTSQLRSFEKAWSFTAKEFIGDSVLTYLIHPQSEAPAEYFSKWFENKINPHLVLNEDLIPLSLKEIASNVDKKTLAKKCFDLVKSEIKYIDIENGINAIVPRNCDKVLKTKLGDCKDMATLLTAIYRYFGFESYVSVSRTNSKNGIFDFPSVGSANHMICSLKLEDEWYYLDPTEKACMFGDPSMQIFNTEAFLIGNGPNYFHKIPNNSRSISKVEMLYSIEKDEVMLELVAQGKLNHLFYYADLEKHNSSEFITKVVRMFLEKDWKIEEITIKDSISILRATIPMNSSIQSTVNGKRMINMSFIPSIENMVKMFYLNNYPLFSSDIFIEVVYDGELKSNFSEDHKNTFNIEAPGDSRIALTLKLNSSTDSNFKTNQIVEEWDKLWSKPLIIEYVNK